MAGKKAAVSPEVRREWLRRHEEGGESPPQIAGADGYDARTVRRQIERARQEREAKDVRRTVLSTALNEHYHDLIDWARKLDDTISWPPTHVPPDWLDHPLCHALKEHLPRSPIWRVLGAWGELMDIYDPLVEELEKFAKAKAQSGGLQFTQGRWEPGLAAGFSRSVVDDVTRRARGQEGLKYAAEVLHRRQEGNLLEVKAGPFTLGYIRPDEADKFKTLYYKLLDEVAGWEQADQFRRVIEELQRLSRVIRDELAVIIWKRVVPGRCRYCPI